MTRTLGDFEFRPVETDELHLSRYSSLLRETFPEATHLTPAYLRWLYRENPDGNVIGFDAWHNGELAAHYVCIPTSAMLHGNGCSAALSLNTATARRFRGRGLMIALAETTYERAGEQGVVAIYGVANASSTPGFVRRLGFQLISPLDAYVGVGSLDGEPITSIAERAAFHRTWTREGLSWRLSNPEAPWFPRAQEAGGVTTIGRTQTVFVRAWANLEYHGEPLPPRTGTPPRGINLHLGLRPRGSARSLRPWVEVPSRLRSSPLNFIFRPLVGYSPTLDAGSVLFGTLDFDAF